MGTGFVAERGADHRALAGLVGPGGAAAAHAARGRLDSRRCSRGRGGGAPLASQRSSRVTNKKPRPILRALMAVVLLAACWTAFAPTRVEPEAWHPNPAPKAEGIYKPNDRLARVQRLAVGKA